MAKPFREPMTKGILTRRSLTLFSQRSGAEPRALRRLASIYRKDVVLPPGELASFRHAGPRRQLPRNTDKWYLDLHGSAGVAAGGFTWLIPWKCQGGSRRP